MVSFYIMIIEGKSCSFACEAAQKSQRIVITCWLQTFLY
ncbi:hypothetical protein D068_cds41590 [Bacillus atrophaeus UCMB-5137]|nr:hypothetical protein D068_cds41590 [Bacillus atrophaeus UCMB-5137]